MNNNFIVQIGHYKIGHTLGRGAFGKVRLGTHVETGVKVAIKILNKRKMEVVPDAYREIEVMKLIN
jgi:serine/threonine protein kinase